MVGFTWHIVTVVLLLSVFSRSFSQTPDSPGVIAALQAADTLQFPQQKALDSLRASSERVYRSLKQTYDSVKDIAVAAVQNARHRIDSMTTLGLDADQFTNEIDSINAWRTKRLDSLAGRVAALQSGVNEKINALDLPPQLSEEARAWTSNFNGRDLKLPVSDFTDVIGKEAPALNLPELELPAVSSAIPEISNANLPSLENPVSTQALPEIPDMNLSTGNIGDLADPLAPTKSGQALTLSGQAPVQQQVAGVVPAIPADAESAAVMLEERATALPQAAGVSQQLDEANGVNPLPATPGDPQAMKEELIEDGKKMAVNHFAGKEKELQQAMDKLATLKKKYGSIESLASLPRKVPNAMRGKPFVERLVPGLALQVGRNDHWLLDVNLYLGYRFTGRITAGAGWNQRIAYNADVNAFSSQPAIYGPRTYGEYSIGKGFSGRLEVEYMNTYVPAPFASNPDNSNGREWVFGVMAGMKKEYTITRRLKGTVLLLYNLYDPHHRSPYRNRLNGRFGVEYIMNTSKK